MPEPMRPAPGVFAPPTSPWRDPFLWLVLLAQTGLSLPGILTRSLWVDEAYSAILARRSFAGIRETLRYDSGPPLHYDLLRLWRWAFGESPLALRSLSLLFALGTTALLYRLAARRFDRATARMAAAVFATLPVVGFYAGQARAYALLAFLAVLLATILAEPHLGRRLRFGALSTVLVATVYTHNIGSFLPRRPSAPLPWRTAGAS